ncbi:serine/threonine-protein kinase [Stackebrandtia nassauensis]|uniref:non-specific serine/threonine protein kinase n=1 Tax=Stackebrandtia nassauensis (strain DSM 44728 / CIP 108903 / NRRL B-16338 / NBRC 102104 / LLR-40K-21) TaxID=446470 RepID=D3PU18_STANL|nr:serine/threonine-protein kinase [Stackebrandtia nassauensis]ADD40964.1 serine/threonine protein kinase [Stackebrandtia nassauensis DSM 44728]
MESARAPHPSPGQDLIGGRYRLDHPIGEGGMGEVWRGTDTRLGRAVAVKLLHPAFSRNARFRARFRAEATLVAALNSPGIATLHDYDEDVTPSGPRSYLVMELVRGASLADILADRDRLPVARTMRIIAEAAEGLDAAHRAGVVHRDVKPGNILIADDGGVKLIDFGIARALGEAGLTESGIVLGTITHTSPEQIADAEPTPAADIYSLGVVAYECLTGNPPFHSTNPVAIMNGHMNHEPPPLPADIPAPVREAVMTALRKQPEDRWESVAAFGQACWAAVEPNTPRPAKSVRLTREHDPGELGTAAIPRPRQKAATVGDGVPTIRPSRQRPAAPGPGRYARIRGLLRPGRHRRALIASGLVTLVAGLLLTVATAPWNPWAVDVSSLGDGGKPQSTVADDGTGTPTGDKSSVDDTSSGASDDKGPKNDPMSKPDDAGTTSGGASDDDAPKGEVPNLIGKHVLLGDNTLRSEGFDNHKPVGVSDSPQRFCEIYDQSPNPGTVTSYKTTVTFYYSGTAEDCAVE